MTPLIFFTFRTAEADTQGILDCNNDREFWAEFGGGVVKVGRGQVLGQDVITELQDPDSPYNTHAISLSTQAEATALWKVYKSAGTCMCKSHMYSSHWLHMCENVFREITLIGLLLLLSDGFLVVYCPDVADVLVIQQMFNIISPKCRLD